MKYIALFLMITTLPTADAAWRVGPRRQCSKSGSRLSDWSIDLLSLLLFSNLAAAGW